MNHKPLLHMPLLLPWFFRTRLCHQFHLLLILYFVAVCTWTPQIQRRCTGWVRSVGRVRIDDDEWFVIDVLIHPPTPRRIISSILARLSTTAAAIATTAAAAAAGTGGAVEFRLVRRESAPGLHVAMMRRCRRQIEVVLRRRFEARRRAAGVHAAMGGAAKGGE